MPRALGKGSITFRLTGQWGKFRRMVSPVGFDHRLRTEIRAANLKGAEYIANRIRQNIGSTKFESNAGLTIHIKHKNTPLLDTGRLLKAVVYGAPRWNIIYIGISSAVIIDGMRADELAEILHNGVTIPVTPKMRAMFYYLSLASMGRMDPAKLTGAAAKIWARQPGGYKPLAEGTTHIEVPPRPFIKTVFEDPVVKGRITFWWNRAFARAATMAAQ